MANQISLTLPCTTDDLRTLECGQEVLLSGYIYTMRDAGHKRALEYLKANGHLPFNLSGQALFYAGPSPAAAGRLFGAIGPTTSGRMDFATPDLLDAGINVMIGKGKRSEDVIEACKRTGSVYFATVGGIAALLAERVIASEVIAWEDLGTEALRRIQIVDLPAFVAIDVKGNTLYR